MTMRAPVSDLPIMLVEAGILGQTVRIILNETRSAPIDCIVAVEPTTWSAVKTRFLSD